MAGNCTHNPVIAMEKKENPDVKFTTPDFNPEDEITPCTPEQEAKLLSDVAIPDYDTCQPQVPDLFPNIHGDMHDDIPDVSDVLEDAVIHPFVDAEAVMTRLDELMQKFDDRLARDEHKDALFDKMYAELSAYKNDIYAKLLKPFIMSAISLLDDTNGFITRLAEQGDSPDPAKMRQFINNLPLDIEDMLEMNGVEIYSDETPVFNPATQRVMKTIECAEADNDKRIVGRLRRGYRWNGVILRPEMVSIYKYKQKVQS